MMANGAPSWHKVSKPRKQLHLEHNIMFSACGPCLKMGTRKSSPYVSSWFRSQMNIQLANVLSDVSGVTGQATKAMAAKLARLVYRMFRYGMQFVDQGAEFYEVQHRKQQVNYLKRKAANLGLQI